MIIEAKVLYSSFEISKLFDEFSVLLNIGYTQSEKIKNYDILFNAYHNGVSKWFLARNLKFSHGSKDSAVFTAKGLDNLKELSTNELREVKLEMILNN